MKRPFHIRFKDQTVIFYEGDLPRRNGIIDFSFKHRINHIRKYYPNLLPKFLKSVNDFEDKFKMIDLSIRKRQLYKAI